MNRLPLGAAVEQVAHALSKSPTLLRRLVEAANPGREALVALRPAA
jgi:hypothetical protein